MRLGGGPLYSVAVRSCLGLAVHVTPGWGGGGGGGGGMVVNPRTATGHYSDHTLAPAHCGRPL